LLPWITGITAPRVVDYRNNPIDEVRENTGGRRPGPIVGMSVNIDFTCPQSRRPRGTAGVGSGVAPGVE